MNEYRSNNENDFKVLGCRSFNLTFLFLSKNFSYHYKLIKTKRRFLFVKIVRKLHRQNYPLYRWGKEIPKDIMCNAYRF